MDTKQISFKERPDTVTLYLIVDLIQEREQHFSAHDECSLYKLGV